MSQPKKKATRATLNSFLALYFVGVLTSQAAAQVYCDSDEPENQLTYLLTDEQSLPIGTAFPIDDRGLFLTAKHLVQYNNADSIRLVNKKYFHEFKFSVVATGAYNTTDIFNPYIYDDWAIIKADIGNKSIVPFKFRADDLNNLSVDKLAAHSPIGSHSAQSQVPFITTSTVPCSANDIMVLSLLEYQKGESGAPVSEGICAYGVTSRFDQDYLSFLDGIVGEQHAFEAINAVVDQLEKSNGALREDVLEEALKKAEDPDLVSCIKGSQMQCAAQHIDEFRELLASIQRVVITPISCVSDSVLRAAFNNTTASQLISFKGNPPSEIDDALSFPILNDQDLTEFSRKIASIRTVRERWSWVSFLQLMDKVSKLNFNNFYNKDGAKAVLRDSLALISTEHGMVNLLQQFREMEVEVKAEQLNAMQSERLALQTQLETLGKQQDQVSATISILNQQTGLGSSFGFPSLAPPSSNKAIQEALEAGEEISKAISKIRTQVADLTNIIESTSQSSDFFKNFDASPTLEDVSTSLSFEAEERDRQIREKIEQSIASEYPSKFYNPDTNYPNSVLAPYVSGPYSSSIDTPNDQAPRFFDGAFGMPAIFGRQ